VVLPSSQIWSRMLYPLNADKLTLVLNYGSIFTHKFS
jgi:hypothetical protein